MKKSQKQGLGIAAGAAALAAAAAGAYYFAGPKGAKHRKQAAAWVEKAKKEAANEVAKMEKMSKQGYHKAVDAVMKNYKKLKHVDQKELLALASELKGHWAGIEKQLATARKKVAKVLPKASSKKRKTTSKK